MLYAALRRRGITRYLTTAIIVCVISTLLLLPAIIWFHLRFNVKQNLLSVLEIEGMLVYVMLCGWVLPLTVTGLYFFSAAARVSRPRGAVPPRQQHVMQEAKAMAFRPPRYQPGVLPPFVFGEDTAWAWLEYASGNFQGQRLALKRSIVMIGRDEECDIWLDDEMASRHHAEVAWDAGNVYLTDCGSLNGMNVNGQRVYGTVLLHSNAVLDICSLRFIFILAEQRENASALDDDPLAKHTWRSSFDLQTGGSEAVSLEESGARTAEPAHTNDILPVTRPDGVSPARPHALLHNPALPDEVTNEPSQALAASAPGVLATFSVQDGELAGRHFAIDRPAITVGRGSECVVVMNDPSISRMHIQFLHQPDGDYIQDLGSSNGTLVNDIPLQSTQRLKAGDVICLGNIHLVYNVVRAVGVTPLPPTSSSPSLRSISGPSRLKLPSRMKQN